MDTVVVHSSTGRLFHVAGPNTAVSPIDRVSHCLPTAAATCRRRKNVKMSKTFISGAVCQQFESEAPTAEEMLDRVVCSREQFSFQMCLESGDVAELFVTGDTRVPDKLLKKHKYLAYLLTVSCSKDVNLTIPLQEIHNIMPVRRECMQTILQTV